MPNHDLKGSRHHLPAIIEVEQLEVFRRENESCGLGFTRFKFHSREPSQLFDRSRYRRESLMNVELGGLRPWLISGVLYIHLHLGVSPRKNLRGRDAKVGVIELGITQSVAEGIKGRSGHIHITVNFAPGTIYPIRFGGRVVVVGGQLPHATGDGDGKTAAGIVVAEEDV